MYVNFYLAVAEDLQGYGVGRELVRLAQEKIGPACNLVLLFCAWGDELLPGFGI